MRRGARWAILFAVLLAGCSPSSDVPWGDYSPSVRTGIDGAADSKDCSALQTYFDNANANNAATQARTGHSNAALMSYIDGKLKGAGCY